MRHGAVKRYRGVAAWVEDVVGWRRAVQREKGTEWCNKEEMEHKSSFARKSENQHSLGAEGVIPGRYIVSLLRVFKQFTHTLPSR